MGKNDERTENAKITNKDDAEKNNEENKQDEKDNKTNEKKVDKGNNGTDTGTEEENSNEELKWPCGVCGDDASDDSVKCLECELWIHIDPCSELPNTNASN